MPGNKPYKIEYLPTVIKADIPNLPKKIRNMIQLAVEERLMVDPIGFGKPLRYNLKGYRRLRVSDYRVVYYIDNKIVTITAIKHRKEVYEE